MFKKFLTLLQRSLWCLVGFEAEEGLLGPFGCWASFQVTYLTPLRPSTEGAVFGLKCNLGTLVSSISSSSSSSSSKLSWPSEFLSLFAELGIGIVWHLKRIMTVQSQSPLSRQRMHTDDNEGASEWNAKDCTHRGWCNQLLVCLVPLINLHQILMLFIKVLWPENGLVQTKNTWNITSKSRAGSVINLIWLKNFCVWCLIYQTLKRACFTTFPNTSKSWKYNVQWSIFDALQGVWKHGKMLSWGFNISSQSQLHVKLRRKQKHLKYAN